MEPLISIRQSSPRRVYAPGEVLACEYQIDAVEAEQITSVEASVLWYTEGKGDEDMGVHFFERRTPEDDEQRDLRRMHRFETEMPLSPLSYSGVIVKIRWCIRIRVYLRRGKSQLAEQPVQLGPLRVAPQP
jgi:hypothetical protein